MNCRKKFINALQMNDIELLRRIPKSDLHNHFYLGGNRDYIHSKTGAKVPSLNHKLVNMDEMHYEFNRDKLPERCFLFAGDHSEERRKEIVSHYIKPLCFINIQFTFYRGSSRSDIPLRS